METGGVPLTKEESMQMLRTRFQEVLDQDSQFCCGGRITMPTARLVVDGVGEVPDTITDEVATKLASVAQQAGYGLGTETLVDTKVRNTLQVEASKVTFNNARWSEALNELVCHISGQLNIPHERVEAKPYKLLLYQTGGHFKPHTDTEKDVAMFGTLAVQFPSEFEGGALIVRHGGKQQIFDFSSDGRKRQKSVDYSDNFNKEETETFHFMAHYADCEHEIKKIKSGYRLAMVYSLCWKDDSPPEMQITKIADKVVGDLLLHEGCLGYMLEHHYSESSLARYGAKTLKGNDKAMCEFLASVGSAMLNKQPDDKLNIFIVKSKRFDEDYGEGDAQIGQPTIENLQDDVFALDGSAPMKGTQEVLKTLQIYDDIINKLDYDDDYHETRANDKWWVDSMGEAPHYIGNEGGASEKLYSCYVLVFWREKWAAGRATVPAATNKHVESKSRLPQRWPRAKKRNASSSDDSSDSP